MIMEAKMNYERCYRSGCYYDMPTCCPCPPPCNPTMPPRCMPNCHDCFGCGYLNIAIPIGLLLLAGGIMIGQNCEKKRP